MRTPSLLLGLAACRLFNVAHSASNGPECLGGSQVVFEVQPFKIICEGGTSTLTVTKTYTLPFGPDETGYPPSVPNLPGPPENPGSPPGSTTTRTITEPCVGSTCVPTTIPPPPNCVDCIVTVITRPPQSGSPPPPFVTTTTTIGCIDSEPCVATTIPPGPDCVDATCTATVITTSSPPPTSDTPPRTTVTTTVGCSDSEPCVATTIPPGPDCVDATCTATVITTSGPPPTSDTPPRTTVTTTVGCSDLEPCVATTIPPAPDCTAITCTATVITTSDPPPTSDTPPRTTLTTTVGCSESDEPCVATTIPPAPDCSAVTCTATVITTTTPTPDPTSSTPPGTTITTTVGCSDSDEPCEATTIPPASDCTAVTCTATVITTTTPTPVPTFSCEDAGGYLIQQTTLYRADLEAGTNVVVSANVGPGGNINAIGYNSLDNYIYGFVITNTDGGITQQLIRIDSEGGYKLLDLVVTGSAQLATGDIDPNGQLWATPAGLGWIQVDLNPDSDTFGEIVDSGTSTRPTNNNFYDWVYLENGGPYLYSVATGANYGARWSIEDHTWEPLDDYGDDDLFLGAMYAVGDELWASDNNSGNIYKFPVLESGGSKTLVTDGPPSGQNDGARCYLAPGLGG